MRTEGVSIQHAENGGEVQIDNFSIDCYEESKKNGIRILRVFLARLFL